MNINDKIMEDQLLKEYTAYLDLLLKKGSGEIFTNGGKEYASELMSRLFNNTQKEARVYCEGFREELIKTDPYWTSLKKYLEDPSKKLLVLVESAAHMNEEPIQLLLQTQQERGDDTVQLKLIQEVDRENIERSLADHDCNFAVFDDSMFRFEYDPVGFRAFGSFNDPRKCAVLQHVFDKAFDRAEPLTMNGLPKS